MKKSRNVLFAPALIVLNINLPVAFGGGILPYLKTGGIVTGDRSDWNHSRYRCPLCGAVFAVNVSESFRPSWSKAPHSRWVL